MGKNANSQKPSETTSPAAVPQGDSSMDPSVGSQDAHVLQVYRANWKLDGLPSGNLEAGETVELDEETAAPLVDGGVLSLVEKGE